MTSLTLKKALRMPGIKPQIAPHSIPAPTMVMINNQAGALSGSRGMRTTALAPNAPINSWPSAPIFHRRMRKARAQARPTRINGVAITKVSEKTPRLPNDASAMCAYVFQGSLPTITRIIAPIIKATRTAPSDNKGDNHQGLSAKRGSNLTLNGKRFFFPEEDVVLVSVILFRTWRLNLLKARTCHHLTDFFDIPIGDFTHNLAFIHHINPVAQGEQFFQFFRH